MRKFARLRLGASAVQFRRVCEQRSVSMRYLMKIATLSLADTETDMYVGFDFDEQIPRSAIEAAGFFSVEDLTPAEVEAAYKVRQYVKASRFQRAQLAEIGIEV